MNPEKKLKNDEYQEYYQRGVKLIEEKNWLLAKKALIHASKLKPDIPEVYAHLGVIYQGLKDAKGAIASYEQALKIKPDYLEANYNLGVVLAETGNLAAASEIFRKVIEIKPDYAQAYNNLAVVLKTQPGDNFKEMETALRKAIALRPNYAEPHYNLAAILTEENFLEEAEKYAREALKLNISYIQAYYNLGFILTEKRLLLQAQQCYQKAINLKPDYAKCHFSLSLNLLLLGNYKPGFAEYEWRWQAYNIFFPKLTQPKWKGDNPKDKTILLISEQGLGDTLQFVRYAYLFKNLGATVKLACQWPLVRLLQQQGIFAEVVRVDQGIKIEYDFYASLMSLPYLCDTTLETIPAISPYLTCDNSLLLPQPRGTKIKVGIVWASGLRDNDPELLKIYHKKSLSLELFAQLLTIDGITLYSLQVGPDAAQINNYHNPRIVNLSPQIKDFVDTAAIIKQLDLVISVDTSVAHLAAAMGKPVWNLLPFSADWRWLLGRNDSPWYPTMRLFRQPKRGDWDSVFQEIIHALKVIISPS